MRSDLAVRRHVSVAGPEASVRRTRRCLHLGLVLAAVVAVTVLAGAALASATGSGVVTVSTFASAATSFDKPYATCADAVGNIYVADSAADVIRKIDHNTYAVTVLAGIPGVSGHADTGPGTTATFWYPEGICYNPADNDLYVSDTWNNTIRQVTTAGVVTTIVGTAGAGGSGSSDGGVGVAKFNGPMGLCCTATGSVLYVCDTGNDTIRLVSIGARNVVTIAGTATLAGSTNASGGAARFWSPEAICIGAWSQDLYVSDTSNHTIRQIVPSGGFPVTTFAGSAGSSGSADGGALARFRYPGGICSDTDGNLYVSDTYNHTIRKVTTSGVVSTIAGSAGASGSANGSGTAARFNKPMGLCYFNQLFVADSFNDDIRQVSVAGTALTYAGAPASFDKPKAACIDPAGNVYVADSNSNTIRKVTPNGVTTILAGSAGSEGHADGVGSAASFNYPEGICYDPDNGMLYVADTDNSYIRSVNPVTGEVKLVVGNWALTPSADGTGANASVWYPDGICYSSVDHNMYIADTNDQTIRRMTTAGVVTTIAGSHGLSGMTDGTGTGARFYYPTGICVGPAGDLYVTDWSTNLVRKVTTSGVVTTVAGQVGGGFADGAALSARFTRPWGIAYDGADGCLYVADEWNYAVRRITLSGAMAVSTPAGVTPPGVPVSGTADGAGNIARFGIVAGLFYDPADGALYVADPNNDTFRKLTVDYTPPATTTTGLVADAHSGWQRSGQFSLSRNLDGTTYYRIDGGSPLTYSAPVSIGTDGSHLITYWSVGPGGAVEAPHQGYANIDISAPTTTASGIPAGWSKTPVTVTLSGSDSLSGRASTEYRLQGGAAWTTYAAPFVVSAQGISTYEFRSTDVAGNVEAVQTFAAKVDPKGPQTLALAKVTVKKGKKATFRFKVSDLTPTAAVTIKIYKHNKLKKTIPVGSAATNSTLSYKWKCKLAKGSYTWKVYAKDLAGNGQSSVGSKKLTVK